jgi:3-oxoacyl-[acyl-carrier protein] reductase
MSQSLGILGHVDCLINCAGISHIGLMTDMQDREWHNIIDSNLSSVFYCCREIVPAMVHEKKGRILNISSVWGNTGASCEVAYSASKGGMNTFTKALAKELAPSGIAVNALACGLIDTTMNQCFSEDERNALCEEIPAGRMGTPQEVADMTALLCRAPYYLTGQIITIDGGWF